MKKILLIEDNTDILDNTSEILELGGYRVFTAENGKLGVEAALAHRPDLIICDVMMPVLDGYGVFHLVRKNPELAGIPFIFLTARTERSDMRKGMELGADDYITKPYSDTELLTAVESQFTKMERLKETLLSESRGTVSLSEALTADQALRELVSHGITNRYKRKQPIFREGNHPQYLFYLQQGKAKVFKTSEEGKDLTVGLYTQGDYIGYIALLEEAPYQVSAEALEDTEITLITRSDFLELVHTHRDVSKRFFQLVAKNNNEKADQLVRLAYNSLRKRVANTLLILRKKYDTGSGDPFTIHIGREELANLAGTATESLIRTLTDFRHDKLIDIREGSIRILNEKKLADMVN